jgi:hypothetical protein
VGVCSAPSSFAASTPAVGALGDPDVSELDEDDDACGRD